MESSMWLSCSNKGLLDCVWSGEPGQRYCFPCTNTDQMGRGAPNQTIQSILKTVLLNALSFPCFTHAPHETPLSIAQKSQDDQGKQKITSRIIFHENSCAISLWKANRPSRGAGGNKQRLLENLRNEKHSGYFQHMMPPALGKSCCFAQCT